MKQSCFYQKIFNLITKQYILVFLVAFVINHLNKEDEDENKKNDANKILFCFLSHFASNQFRNNQVIFISNSL